ncbi:hypothetical protein JB92DRAFT_2837672 [Gautieria morchelliformis]|nr:hypothetical protein JB92DRAFT_2837672 [Gautieria morchelliformis]
MKLQLACEHWAKQAEAQGVAHVKSQKQQETIETMVAKGLSTKEIQEYLNNPHADSADSENGMDSIEYTNNLQDTIEHKVRPHSLWLRVPSLAVYTQGHIFHVSVESLSEGTRICPELSNCKSSMYYPDSSSQTADDSVISWP